MPDTVYSYSNSRQRPSVMLHPAYGISLLLLGTVPFRTALVETVPFRTALVETVPYQDFTNWLAATLG